MPESQVLWSHAIAKSYKILQKKQRSKLCNPGPGPDPDPDPVAATTAHREHLFWFHITSEHLRSIAYYRKALCSRISMQAMSKCVSESAGVIVPLYVYVCVFGCYI